MKNKTTSRYVQITTYFSLLFLLLSFSMTAQCPTINDSNPPPICDASGYTFGDLSASAFVTDGGDGIVWYNADTGGTIFNSNELVSEGTFYVDNLSASCPVPRASITIDFQVDPSGENLDRIYCSNEGATIQTYIDDVLQGSIPPGGSVEIYNDFNLSNPANPTDVIPLGASNFYVVFVDNGGCESQIEVGQVGVFTAPNDPTPATPQAFCTSSSPLVGNLDPGTTSTNFLWYDSLDGLGNPVPPALQASTPLVDGNTYYVQIDDIFCVSNAIAVTVDIDTPADAGNSAILNYCNDNIPTADFDLFDELGGFADTTGFWSGPITTSNGHLGTVNISSLTTAGSYTFNYTVTTAGACPNAISSVIIVVNEALSSGTPSATNPATFCESGVVTNLDLFSLLDNEDTGGLWTQGTLSTDPAVTSPLDLTGFTPGTYDFTYTQNASPNLCPDESTTVQVVVLANPNAGNAVNQTFCENNLTSSSPFNLFDALDGSQDNNSGIWTNATNVTVTSPIDITSLTVTGSPYEFTYTIDNGTCTDSETITITVTDAPESGTPNAPLELCLGSVPSGYNLFDLLTGEDQTGLWYEGLDNTGVQVSNPVDLTALTPGTYNFTYEVQPLGSCNDELVTVSIIIHPLPNTGVPTPAIFCENNVATNSPLDLFDQLAGEDSGGTWTDDNASGALTGNNVDLTLLAIGSYNFTYTITDVNNCTNSSLVTITIDDAPEAGTPVATLPEFCEGSAPASYNLFDLLEGEDPSGEWFVGTDNTGANATNPIDLSGFTPGTYNFTYDVDAIGSCDEPLITVSITINPLPNTGTPAPAIFCENDLATNSPLDLFDQLTGEDSGGTWTDDNASGALTGSNVDLTLLAIGSYNFTYTIIDANNCTNSSLVTITVEDAPESGTPNAPVEFCVVEITAAQTYNLFDLLEGEDQLGTWNDDDASGALSGNTVTIDGLSSGTYNFTYNVTNIGSCDDVDVTVSIVINDTPAPTTASVLQEYCDSATVADLEATGTSIQWYADATGGTPLDATTALENGEDYYATQTDGVTNCESSIRTQVDVAIYQSPDAGNANATALVVCNDNNSIDLSDGLDGTEDPGGVWNDDDATGALTGNILDATALAAGTYEFTYAITASAPCVDDSTTITVTIEAPQSAGTDTTLDICSTGTVTDLFTLLGAADVGGTWSPALTSGTGMFNPAVDASNTYTYTITNACGTVSSDVVVTVIQAPNAGANATLATCIANDATDLFTLLGTDAQTGGAWSPALASGTGVFNPAVDTAGTYIYTVTAIAPCSPDASAEVTITVDDSPPVTVLSGNPSFCLVDNPTVMDLNNSINFTGTVNWYEDAALTLLLSETEALIDGAEYFATQTNGVGCESSVAIQIEVAVNDAPTPTLADASINYCINDRPTLNTLLQNIVEYDVDLNNILWYDVATGGTPISEDTELSVTTYYAALVSQTNGCESSVRLEITPDITACGKISLPEGFSPNGDGVNETYEIDNLDIIYPNFELEIYNRNGNLVYKGNANTPRFDGTSNQGRIAIKGELPVGVYFYIFRFKDGVNKPEQGRLYLSR